MSQGVSSSWSHDTSGGARQWSHPYFDPELELFLLIQIHWPAPTASSDNFFTVPQTPSSQPQFPPPRGAKRPILPWNPPYARLQLDKPLTLHPRCSASAPKVCISKLFQNWTRSTCLGSVLHDVGVAACSTSPFDRLDQRAQLQRCTFNHNLTPFASIWTMFSM